MAQKYPAIPDPILDLNSVREATAALKEGQEILTRIRGDRSLSAVTWQDLLALGLIKPDQIPKTPSSGR